MKTTHTRAFTLIELLVVISIIGMLSSVILASVTSAREKARMAAGQQFAGNVYRAKGIGAWGYWKFDELPGTAVATDSSLSNDATLRSGSVQWHADVPYSGAGTSMLFNGTTYLCANRNAQMAITQSGFTMMAWIKPSVITGQDYNMIMGVYRPYLALRGNSIYTGKIHLSFSTGGGTSRNVYSSRVLEVGKWYHVAAIYDSAGNTKIYIDGKEDAKGGPYTGIDSNHATYDFCLGNYLNSTSYRFRGNIDEAMFITEALGSAEIEKHYAETKGEYVAVK